MNKFLSLLLWFYIITSILAISSLAVYIIIYSFCHIDYTKTRIFINNWKLIVSVFVYAIPLIIIRGGK